MITEKEAHMLRESIRIIAEEIISERKRKRKNKPGGPRTKIGALMQVYPEEAFSKIKNALRRRDGNVKDAAADLGVSPRTAYGYVGDDARLEKVRREEQQQTEKE